MHNWRAFIWNSEETNSQILLLFSAAAHLPKLHRNCTYCQIAYWNIYIVVCFQQNCSNVCTMHTIMPLCQNWQKLSLDATYCIYIIVAAWFRPLPAGIASLEQDYVVFGQPFHFPPFLQNFKFKVDGKPLKCKMMFIFWKGGFLEICSWLQKNIDIVAIFAGQFQGSVGHSSQQVGSKNNEAKGTAWPPSPVLGNLSLSIKTRYFY